MISHHLVFAHPRIENNFRAVVNEYHDEEIGGYLFAGHDFDLLPVRTTYHKMKKLLGLGRGAELRLIHGFMLLPNHAKDKESKFGPWDAIKADEVAKASASAHNAWPIHFHTHPFGSSLEPSKADIAFACSLLNMFEERCGRVYAQFCIATPYPLRLRWYLLETSLSAVVSKGFSLQTGDFFSWRSKALRGLLNE